MKNKRNICILLIFLVFMITISAASAAEDVTSDLTSMDDNEEIILEDSPNEEIILSDESENLVLEENAVNEEPVSEANAMEPKLSESAGTFTDLENDINGNDDTEISLNKNYVFNSDSDSDYQNGIRIKRAVTINGNGMTIDGNKLARAFYVSGKNVIIKNITFINGNLDDVTGGAIFWEGNDGSLCDCTFINNTANSGGALMWYGTNGHISNCTFINNTATNVKTSGGGALLLYGANFSVSNCTFEENHAKVGGAVHFYYTEGTISDSDFINNTASQTGGAIYTEEISGIVYNSSGNKYINIFNCTFEENHADMDGGAIGMYYSANCSVSNCTFTCNTADDGGAIYVDSLMNNSVSNSNFIANKAEYSGGAIFWISDNGSISNSNFTENEADEGGAVYWFTDNGVITDSTFTNNTATRNGGALDGKSNAINCNFTENKATLKGGAMDGGTATNCTFTKNNAISEGNGYGGAINKGNAINCNFTENNAGFEGGAINQGNAINCNFINNTANWGGAINQGNAINCNFTDNKAYEGGAEPDPDECKSDAMYDSVGVNCNFINNNYTDTYLYSSADLSTSDYTSTYNSGETLDIELIAGTFNLDGIPTKITVYQSGEEIGTYYAPTGDGWEVSLSPGSYSATISIEELPEITPVHANLIVNKAATEISTYDATFEFNTTRQYVVVTLRDETGKTISWAQINIQIDDTVKTDITDQNGEIRVSPRNLGVGQHTLTISFNENENYTGTTNSSIMTIIPSGTIIDCEDYVDEYNSTDEIVITLYDSEAKVIKGVDVTVDITSPKTYTTDNKGQIRVPINELNAGFYRAIISFDGNENFTSSNQRINVNINKIASQIIYQNMTTTAVDVATDGRVGEYFTITLKDSKGNALANKFVQIGFNGNVYNRTTKVDGSASLQINLQAAGTYTFVVVFLGDENYNGSFVVAKIVVKKQKGSLTVPNKSYSASAKTKTLTATFKSASGKVVKGKKVTFTVNGKTYSATTDAKGVAKVNVSLNKKGTYSFTAKFAGNNMYAAISKTAKLTIK